MSRLRTLALAVAASCALPLPAAANPIDAFGLGARAIGLAGAYGALTDDFAANYYNPAAIAAFDDLRIEIGYVHVAPNLNINDEDLGVDGVDGLQGGLVLPGSLFGHRVGVSLGLYLPNERVTRLRSLPQSQPRFVLYDNRPQRLYIATSIALEILKDTLYLGAGFTALSDTEGRLHVNGAVDFNNAAGTALFSDVDVNFVAVRYLTAGLLVTPGDHLRVGLTFRDEFDLSADLGLIVDADIILNGDTPTPSVLVPDGHLEVISQNSNLFSPRQLSLSVAWQADGWALAAELTWLQWSRFKSPTARLTINLDVPGLGLTIPETPPPDDPGFNDIFVPRFGGEVDLYDHPNFGLTLRGGYFYEPSPAPDQPGANNLVDGDKHGVGFGVSLRFSELTDVLPKPFYLDLAGQIIVLTERRVEKSDPANPVGDYRASGTFLGFSATTKWLF